MRAFALRPLVVASQMGLASLSLRTSRMMCSTAEDPKKETNEKKEETENNEKVEEVTVEQFETLQKELKESEESLEEMKKQLAYRIDDGQNAVRNGKEDLEKSRLYGITKFAKDLLEVPDTLEKGVEAFKSVSEEQLKADKDLEAIFTGLKLTMKVVQQNLGKHGVEKMNVKAGTEFDHDIHDALATTPVTPEAPPDHVSFVLKDGYKIKDRVLRAAQVGVAVGEN